MKEVREERYGGYKFLVMCIAMAFWAKISWVWHDVGI